MRVPLGAARSAGSMNRICRTLSQRARGFYGSIMREHCLSRNRETQPCAARLLSDVWIPDRDELGGAIPVPLSVTSI